MEALFLDDVIPKIQNYKASRDVLVGEQIFSWNKLNSSLGSLPRLLNNLSTHNEIIRAVLKQNSQT